MHKFTLLHVNGETRAENRVNVAARDFDSLVRMFNAMTEGDPDLHGNGATFEVPYGRLTIMPFYGEEL